MSPSLPQVKPVLFYRVIEMSELQTFRRSYIPPLPTILTKDVEIKKCEALGAAADHGTLILDRITN